MPAITESGEALKQRYRNERLIELMFEEHRLFDVRRWVIGPEAYDPAWKVDILYPWLNGATAEQPIYEPQIFEQRAWEDKAYFFPIYREEMNKNELLIQNPGY